ncbi:EamA family transporter [bacterium]|nr:EamA family transporter [bacterium]
MGLAAIFVLTWNSGFIGAEYGLPFAGPFTILFWRYFALTGLLLVYLLLRGRLSMPGWGATGHAALVGFLSHGVWLSCVLLALDEGVPAGIVALVVALQPLTTGVFSGMATGERTTLRQWIGLLIGFAGVATAVGARLNVRDGVSAFGYLVPFVSVVAITIASLLQRRRELQTERTPIPMDLQMFFQVTATCLGVAVPALFLEQLQTDWTPPFIAAMTWLTLVVSLASYTFMWMLIERMDATRVAGLFYLGPPVTMLMAWIAFGDTLLLTDILGLFIATGGVVLVQGGGLHRGPRAD